MTTATVRRLRVAAASEPAARRFVTTLEDALRCATLPGDDRRVVVVRRLALGRVAHDAGTQRLSLLIEQRLARGEIAWAEAHEPPDAGADAVGFAGALQARVHLARRLVAAAPCDAWYWPLAIPEYRRDLAPREALRRLAQGVAAWPEARVALPDWLAQVVRAGGATALSAAIDETLGRTLLREAGIAWPGDSMSAPAATTPHSKPSASSPGATQPAPQPRRDASTPSFVWPVWLKIALAHVPGNSRDRLAVQLPLVASAGRQGADTNVRVPAPRATGGMATKPQAWASTTQSQDGSRAAELRREQVANAPPSTAQDAARPRRLVPAPTSAERDWLATACGGLPFLLPVLARAGLVEGDSPEATRAATLHLLQAALRRVHAADGDAAWLLVADLPPLPPAVAREAQARALRELGLARRWLHRHARLGLVSLVRRPARLSLTSTHIDVRFPLAGADLRVRRAGLDLDPGWLPWFGRVLAFQFIGRQP
jgi:hypothetical protein